MKNRLHLFCMAVLLCFGFIPTQAADVTDVLTYTIHDVGLNKSYADFSGVTLTSDAVYAGNNASGVTASGATIQLRNTNNAGIVTTTSGGTVKSVKITWNSNTNTARVLKVYGKNSAYTAASDLYGNDKGTEIASFTCSDGDQTITITGSYQYIGIRSNNGALYVDQIEITWTTGGTTTTVNPPTISGTTPFETSSSISITADSGASIYYTTDGTTPTTSSNLYSTAFSITATTTVKAIAVKNSVISTVATETFYKKPSTPVISGTDNFTTSSSISITADVGASIYYTTDGTTPSSGSTAYTGAFSISATTTVKAIAYDTANNASDVATQTFTKSSAPVEGGSATYIFNTQAGLEQLGLDVPGASSGTNLETTAYTVSPVSMTATSGSTPTRIWNTSGKYDLRVYTNGSLTFSVPEGYYLTGITFTQGTKTDFNFTADSGTLSGYVWTSANTTTESVTFTASATSNIGTVTVNYEILGSAPVSITNFNEMKALESGKNVILTLSESNAAVIQYVDPPSAARTSSAQNAYIRDNYSAVQFANVASASRSWHTQASGALIGKIYGQYVVENGMPKFVESSKTDAWQMLCLDNYAAISPRTVSIADLVADTYRADYLQLSEVSMTKSGDNYFLSDGTNTVSIDNGFNLSTISLPSTVTGKRFTVTGILGTTSESASQLHLLTLQQTISSLALNENQTNSTLLAAHDGESVNLTLTRALTSGTWNTICLPFDLAEAADAIGEVRIAALTGYDATANTLEFTTVTDIEAGKPYLIYPTGTTASNIVLNGVEVTNTTVPVTYGNYTFTPVFDPTELQKDDKTSLFLGSGNTLYYPNVTAEMKAFRAYFKTNGAQSAPAKVQVDGQTTGITSVDLNNSASSDIYYDLSGRRIGSLSDMFQKGIYVKEGSKVIIK